MGTLNPLNKGRGPELPPTIGICAISPALLREQEAVETAALEVLAQLLRRRLVRKRPELDPVERSEPTQIGLDDARLITAEQAAVFRLQPFPGRLRLGVAPQRRELDTVTAGG